MAPVSREPMPSQAAYSNKVHSQENDNVTFLEKIIVLVILLNGVCSRALARRIVPLQEIITTYRRTCMTLYVSMCIDFRMVCGFHWVRPCACLCVCVWVGRCMRVCVCVRACARELFSVFQFLQ